MPTQLIDHYSVLGVARDATTIEIKKQYRALARQLHPDVAGSDPQLAERFKAITFAYEILGNVEKRAELDRMFRTRESVVGPLRTSPAGTRYAPPDPFSTTTPYSYPKQESVRLDQEWRKFSSRPVDLTRRIFRHTSKWEAPMGLMAIAGIIYCLVRHINMDPLIFLFSTSSSKPLQDDPTPFWFATGGAMLTYVLLIAVWLHAVWKYHATKRQLERPQSTKLALFDATQELSVSRLQLTGSTVPGLTGATAPKLERPHFGELARELFDMAGWFLVLAVVGGAFIGHFCF